jgi:hypothetical protein
MDTWGVSVRQKFVFLCCTFEGHEKEWRVHEFCICSLFWNKTHSNTRVLISRVFFLLTESSKVFRFYINYFLFVEVANVLIGLNAAVFYDKLCNFYTNHKFLSNLHWKWKTIKNAGTLQWRHPSALDDLEFKSFLRITKMLSNLWP